MALGGQTYTFLIIFAALLAALLWRSPRGSHAMIAIAGVIGVAYGFEVHGAYAVVLPAIVALVGGVLAGRGLYGGRKVRFDRYEQRLRRGPFAKMNRRTARHLLDQGIWIDADPGDVLTREGEPVSHLHWLAQGSAEVVVEDTATGHCGPHSFIGEATVFSGEPATGTVRLIETARLWSIEAETLRAYADAHPDVRQILDHGFTLSLAEKLDAMNRADAA